MKLIKDPNIDPVEGKEQIGPDGEYIFICPVCDKDITDRIDDFGPKYECPNCFNAVRFPDVQKDGER